MNPIHVSWCKHKTQKPKYKGTTPNTHAHTLALLTLKLDTCLIEQNPCTHNNCCVRQMVFCRISHNSVLAVRHRIPASRFSSDRSAWRKRTSWIALQLHLIALACAGNCQRDLGGCCPGIFLFSSLVVFSTTNFDQLEFTFKLEDWYSGCWCTDLAAGQLMMQDG